MRPCGSRKTPGATLALFDDTGLSVQFFTAPYARNALRTVEAFVGIETKL